MICSHKYPTHQILSLYCVYAKAGWSDFLGLKKFTSSSTELAPAAL